MNISRTVDTLLSTEGSGDQEEKRFKTKTAFTEAGTDFAQTANTVLNISKPC